MFFGNLGAKLWVLFNKLTKMHSEYRFCTVKKQFYTTFCRYFRKKHYFCTIIEKLYEKLYHK